VFAEANEGQQKDEESNGQQSDHPALIARPLPRLQFALPLLWAQRIRAV